MRNIVKILKELERKLELERWNKILSKNKVIPGMENSLQMPVNRIPHSDGLPEGISWRIENEELLYFAKLPENDLNSIYESIETNFNRILGSESSTNLLQELQEDKSFDEKFQKYLDILNGKETVEGIVDKSENKAKDILENQTKLENSFSIMSLLQEAPVIKETKPTSKKPRRIKVPKGKSRHTTHRM